MPARSAVKPIKLRSSRFDSAALKTSVGQQHQILLSPTEVRYESEWRAKNCPGRRKAEL